MFISNHSQQDEGRRSHHEAIPASMPRQASYPTAGRETESSPSDRACHSCRHTHHPTLLRRGATLTHGPDSSRQAGMPIPYPVRAGSDTILKFTALQRWGSLQARIARPLTGVLLARLSSRHTNTSGTRAGSLKASALPSREQASSSTPSW